MPSFLRQLLYFFRRRQFDADLREELEFHRASKERELERAGATPTEARREASRALGGVALAQEESRELWVFRWCQGLGQDVRVAMRSLLRMPVVTSVAVLSLALGIGANTAIFSIIDGLLLRGLPVTAPDRLVTVASEVSAEKGFTAGWSDAVYEQLRTRAIFDGISASASTRFNLATQGEAQYADGLWASASFLDVLGVRAWLGRTFTDADDVRASGPDGVVALISYGFWQRRFGGTPDAIGRSLTIEGVPATIVGVTPPSFFGVTVGNSFDIMLPLQSEPAVLGKGSHLDQRSFSFLTVIGRLKPDQTVISANAALKGIEPQVRDATRPENLPPRFAAQYLSGRMGFALVPTAAANSTLQRRFERPVLAMMGVVLLVLVIACANIANLMLARAIARRQEMSVRRALGASRWRLARQLLVESAALAVAGAVPGILLASWASQLLVHQLSTRAATVFLDVSIDRRVLLFTLVVTCVTTGLFGVVPALRVSAATPSDTIRTAGRGTVGDGRTRFSTALVVAQVALSVVLVFAATLFIRTFWNLANRDLGFTTDHALLVSVNSQRASVVPAARLRLYQAVRDTVRTIPGVNAAALSTLTPVGGRGMVPHIDVAGGVDVPDSDVPPGNGRANVISAGWLEALGTPLIAGRDFSDRDRDGAPPVALVNEALARAFVPGKNPLGRVVTVTGFAPRMEIIGVVADAVYDSPREVPQPTLYLPFAQQTPLPPSVTLTVRTSTPPSQVVRTLATAIQAIEPNLVLTFQPLGDQIDAALVQERLVAFISGFFGLLALLLGGLGLYGVTAYTVSRRRREIGLRMALGASGTSVVRLILGRIMALVSLGLLTGTIISLWVSGIAKTLLYGVDPHDPRTLMVAGAFLIASSMAAAGWPAWRASRVDPAIELRNE